MEQLIEEALQMLTIATEALKEIRDTQVKICSNFILCDHKSCQSCYRSWDIANKALHKISK